MRESVRRCDVCKKAIAEGSRWFALAAHIVGVNGERKEVVTPGNPSSYLDACSALCVSTAINDLVRQVS